MMVDVEFLWVRGIYGRTPEKMRDPLEKLITDNLEEAGVECVHSNVLYPFTTILKAGSREDIKKQARRIANKLYVAQSRSKRQAIIAHSHGGQLTYHLPWVYDGPSVNAHLFHPAADSEDIWSASRFDRVNVFHCYQDKALKASSIFRWFGQLGRYGYEGPREEHPAIFNYPVQYEMDGWKHHDDWFKGLNVSKAADIIADSEIEALKI